VPEAVPNQEDYFGFERVERFIFPDGVTYIEYKAMNEGAKARYQSKTVRPIVIEKGGSASTRIDPAGQRHELIIASVTRWNLTRGGKAVHFSERMLRDWLSLANPVLVENLEKAIRKVNPWLNDDLTVEAIDAEIESLQELRREVVEREQGEGSSATK